MAIEIVSFPINSMVDLSIAMLVHQRVVAWAQEILTHTKPQSPETSVFGPGWPPHFSTKIPGSFHRAMPMFHREISSEQNFHNLQLLFDIPNV